MIRRRDESLPNRVALREADKKARKSLKMKRNEPDDRPKRSLLQSPSGKMDGSPPPRHKQICSVFLVSQGQKTPQTLVTFVRLLGKQESPASEPGLSILL